MQIYLFSCQWKVCLSSQCYHVSTLTITHFSRDEDERPVSLHQSKSSVSRQALILGCKCLSWGSGLEFKSYYRDWEAREKLNTHQCQHDCINCCLFLSWIGIYLWNLILWTQLANSIIIISCTCFHTKPLLYFIRAIVILLHSLGV